MADFESLKLAVWSDAGESETVELPGPGGTIRVAVGEHGRQSGIWRIWAPPNKSDVYIGVRAILGYQKWSLHESGDWRHQWVNTEKAAEVRKADGRIIDRWQQPAEMGNSGWTRGFSIRVRHQDLVDVANSPQAPKDTVWIPAPPEGHFMGLHVAIVRPVDLAVPLTGFIPVGGFTLLDGRAVVLCVTVEELTDEQNQVIATAIEVVVQEAKRGGVDLSTVAAPRGALSCASAEGDRSVWDVAVNLEH
jgi:hypothetical protein